MFYILFRLVILISDRSNSEYLRFEEKVIKIYLFYT